MSTAQIPAWRLQDRLARALDEGAVTVSEMADELGVNRNTVGNYLGGRSKPSRSVLRVWALRCGVPFEWLNQTDDDGPNTGAGTSGVNSRDHHEHSGLPGRLDRAS